MTHCSRNTNPLSQLLLDEERPQVRQLPRAGGRENSQLDECPADDTAVSGLGLVTELGFALLKNKILILSEA